MGIKDGSDHMAMTRYGAAEKAGTKVLACSKCGKVHTGACDDKKADSKKS